MPHCSAPEKSSLAPMLVSMIKKFSFLEVKPLGSKSTYSTAKRFEWIRRDQDRIKIGFYLGENNFILCKKLGKGSNGTAYCASSKEYAYVVKDINSACNSALIREYEMTSRVIAGLSSGPTPVVLPTSEVYFCCHKEVDHADKKAFCEDRHLIIMPYVSNSIDLQKYFSLHIGQGESFFVAMLSLFYVSSHMANALQNFIHRLGLVHGDVKADNFLVILDKLKRIKTVIPIDFGRTMSVGEEEALCSEKAVHLAPECNKVDKKSVSSLSDCKEEHKLPKPDFKQDAFSLGMSCLWLLLTLFKRHMLCETPIYQFLSGYFNYLIVKKHNIIFREKLITVIKASGQDLGILVAYVNIVCDLICFDPKKRMGVEEASRKLQDKCKIYHVLSLMKEGPKAPKGISPDEKAPSETPPEEVQPALSSGIPLKMTAA